MKKIVLILSVLLLSFVVISLSSSYKSVYKNGTYTAESQSKYTDEPFWAQVTITLRNDSIKDIQYQIIDKEKNEVFSPEYEKHYSGNSTYVQQCRNDLQGMKTYCERLKKFGKLEKVDAVTGATWSYNLFKDAITIALQKARIN